MGTETMCGVCGREEYKAATGCARGMREFGAAHQEMMTGDCYRIGYAREKERAEVAEALAERRRIDRAQVLDVKTTEGLSASEWMMRTARAETALAVAEAGQQRAQTLALAIRVEREEAWQALDTARRLLAAAEECEQVQALELERHRHGTTVESDGICPDSLALTEAREALRAVVKHYSVADGHLSLCGRGASVRTPCCWVPAALAAILGGAK